MADETERDDDIRLIQIDRAGPREYYVKALARNSDYDDVQTFTEVDKAEARARALKRLFKVQVEANYPFEA